MNPSDTETLRLIRPHIYHEPAPAPRWAKRLLVALLIVGAVAFVAGMVL